MKFEPNKKIKIKIKIIIKL